MTTEYKVEGDILTEDLEVTKVISSQYHKADIVAEIARLQELLKKFPKE